MLLPLRPGLQANAPCFPILRHHKPCRQVSCKQEQDRLTAGFIDADEEADKENAHLSPQRTPAPQPVSLRVITTLKPAAHRTSQLNRISLGNNHGLASDSTPTACEGTQVHNHPTDLPERRPCGISNTLHMCWN